MKQTAVEWLENQIICQQNIYIDLAKKNKSLTKAVDAILTATTLLKIKCKNGKEMETQQKDDFAIEFYDWCNSIEGKYLIDDLKIVGELYKNPTTNELLTIFKNK